MTDEEVNRAFIKLLRKKVRELNHKIKRGEAQVATYKLRKDKLERQIGEHEKTCDIK